MLGLNLNFNTVIICILGYVLFVIINNKFKLDNKKQKDIDLDDSDSENDNDIEGFENENNTSNIRPTPAPNDTEDKRYTPVLNQNVKDICTRESKDYCLPYKNNEIPEKEEYQEPEKGNNNLLGHNFLNAKHHTQINKVGNYKGNKKVDIRPEPINPQVGVSPTTQSIINIDYKNDEEVYLYSQNYNDIWQRLI
jgi:hypothetical protein